MKKLTAIFLAISLCLSLGACGGGNGPAQSGSAPASPLDLLNTVWGSHSEDEKFPVAGGDMSEENMNMEGPGRFALDDPAMLDTTLGLPESEAGKIDEAASLVHMMNANTFTCGAFRLKNAGDAEGVASAIKDNLMQRQWMCGFPDKLVVMEAEGCVVSIFGDSGLVDTFKSRLEGACAGAKTLCDEPIA